jgi:hypothetical protein
MRTMTFQRSLGVGIFFRRHFQWRRGLTTPAHHAYNLVAILPHHRPTPLAWRICNATRASNTICVTHLLQHQSQQHHLRDKFVTPPKPATPFAWHIWYTIRASNTTFVTHLVLYQSQQHHLCDSFVTPPEPATPLAWHMWYTARATNATCVTHLVHC